jgi:hypothetical protein
MRRGRSFGAWLIVVANVTKAAFIFVFGFLRGIASGWFGNIIRRLIGIAARGRGIVSCHGGYVSWSVKVCLPTERPQCSPALAYAVGSPRSWPLFFCSCEARHAVPARPTGLHGTEGTRCLRRLATDIPDPSMGALGAFAHARHGPSHIAAYFPMGRQREIHSDKQRVASGFFKSINARAAIAHKWRGNDSK